MSLDIYLMESKNCPHCGGEISGEHELFWQNYTHNVIRMWDKAGVYDALYMSEGKHARDYIEALEKGVADFEANISEYQKLDPANKWGSAESALPWLKRALAAFKEYPDSIIHVSK